MQQFFDTLIEVYVNADAEGWLIMDTTQAELDYIATRARKAQLAKEVGSAGGVEDKVAMAAEEELARWAAAAGGASSAGTEAPRGEEVTGESSEEEAETAGPTPAMGRGRVLRRASSGKPVQPGRAVQPQQT